MLKGVFKNENELENQQGQWPIKALWNIRKLSFQGIVKRETMDSIFHIEHFQPFQVQPIRFVWTVFVIFYWRFSELIFELQSTIVNVFRNSNVDQIKV